MNIRYLSKKGVIAGLAIATCLASSLPLVAHAQSGLPGLTIFGGPEEELGYRFDFGGTRATTDRLRLRVPADKLELGVSEFLITYPESYQGDFRPNRIDVRVDGDDLAIDDVVWDEERREIHIYMVEPIPAQTAVEVVMSDLYLPRRSGMHFFEGYIYAPGDVSISRKVGTWVVRVD